MAKLSFNVEDNVRLLQIHQQEMGTVQRITDRILADIPTERLRTDSWREEMISSLAMKLVVAMDAADKQTTTEHTELFTTEPPFGVKAAFRHLLSEVCQWLGLSWRHKLTTQTHRILNKTVTTFVCPHTRKQPTETHIYWLAGELPFEGSREEWQLLRKLADEALKFREAPDYRAGIIRASWELSLAQERNKKES